jgi:glucose/arabinose dehydrogenase
MGGEAERVVSAPIAGVPDVKVVGADGLHDPPLDPDFARNRTLYFYYFAPLPGRRPAMPLHDADV